MSTACSLCSSERDAQGVALLLPCARSCGRAVHAACALALVCESAPQGTSTGSLAPVPETAPVTLAAPPVSPDTEKIAEICVHDTSDSVPEQQNTEGDVKLGDNEEGVLAGGAEGLQGSFGDATEHIATTDKGLMAGDVLLSYECGCSGERPRLFRLAVAWPDAVHLSLDHLTRTEAPDHEIEGLRLYHFQRICSVLAAHWRLLWPQPQAAGTAWHSSVVSALSIHAGRRFFNGKAVHAERCWALLDGMTVADLEDALAASLEPTRRRVAEITALGLVAITGDALLHSAGESEAQAAPKIRRGSKRTFSNLDFDRPNPGGALAVRFSALPTHTSPHLRVSLGEDGVSRVTAFRAGGYRMARATHGIDRPGCWYFEVTLERDPPGEAPTDAPIERRPAVRLGVAQVLAQTEAPVGFDEYGYAVRSRDCAAVHCAHVRPRPKDTEFSRGFGPGDTVGVLVVIPDEDVSSVPPSEMSARIANIERTYAPLRLGDYKVRQDLHGRSSAVAFFLNGAPVPGAVFRPVYRAKYYPAVSLFGAGISAALNCGPEFRCPPSFMQSTDQPGNVEHSSFIADAEGGKLSLEMSIRPVCEILPPH